MSKIGKEEVENIALLARLELNDSDVKKYQKELSGILTYVETINTANTKNIEASSQVTGLTGVVREDVKTPSNLTRDEIFSNTPDKKDGYIKVKPVL